jgi:hypothetical protein
METGIHELTAGYALDALEPAERAAYEAHLPDCQRCRDELTSFWQTTEALAVAASGPAPPQELRGRILAAARAEPQVVVPLESRRQRVIPVLAAAAAVAAIVAVAVGIWATRLSDDLHSTRSALERERAAAAVLANPDSRTVTLTSGKGRLVVDPEGQAVLVAAGLDPAPRGKTYETWVIAQGTPQPAGLFPGRSGTDVIGVEGTVGRGDKVAVTIEKAGGAKAPTSNLIVVSSPV